MPEEQDKYKTYTDDKPKYNKDCYSEWEAWFDRFRSRIRENNQLFNNYSEDLVKRKKDKSLSRACLFIPVTNPAVLSLAAHANNLLWSVKEPIEVTAKPGTEQENAENVKRTIHDYFEKDDFQSTWLEVQMAKHIFPIAFLQVSETEDEEKVLSIVEDEFGEYPQAGVKLGKKKKWETEKGQWRPTVILRTQESVFYDPTSSKWNQKTFIGTITPLTLGELVARKKSMDYEFDVEELKKNGEKMDEDEFLNELSTSSGQESKSSTGESRRYKVIENWHKVEKEDGTIERKITTTCGKVELRDTDYPYEKLDIPDPFIPIIGYPVLNRVEGNTTTDLLKHLQHAINDFFNITIDAGKYGLFPPRLRDSRLKIITKQETAPGVEWVVKSSDPTVTVDNGIKQMFNVTPMSKDFFALINVLRELVEIVGGVPEDIMMGASTDPQEKATKTKLRAQGASTRLAGISILMDVQTLKQLAYVMWVMTLERLPYDKKYQIEQGKEEIEFGLEQINGRFGFGVPHLSGMADREVKIARLRELLVTLSQMPFAESPALYPVFYTLLKRISELSLIADFDEIFPEELVEQLESPVEGQGAGEGEGTATSEGVPPVVQAAIAEKLSQGGMG